MVVVVVEVVVVEVLNPAEYIADFAVVFLIG